MAKRLTDTEKWKKPFLRGLQGAYKLLWLYVCDDCDHAGIWQVDIEVAEIRVGEKIDKEVAEKCLKEKIVVFDGGKKWFIPTFIEFQYSGGLNPSNKAHGSVIQMLRKYNLVDGDLKPLPSPYVENEGAYKGLTRGYEGELDKDKDIAMDKEMDIDKDIGEEKKAINIEFDVFWELYDKKRGDKDKLERKWFSLSDSDRRKVIEHIPIYKKSEPDKQYRKDPSTYLNNKSWNDEIIVKTNGAYIGTTSKTGKSTGLHQVIASLEQDLRSGT